MPWGVVGSYGKYTYVLVSWGVQIVKSNLNIDFMVKLLKIWCRGVSWGAVGCRGVPWDN